MLPNTELILATPQRSLQIRSNPRFDHQAARVNKDTYPSVSPVED